MRSVCGSFLCLELLRDVIPIRDMSGDGRRLSFCPLTQGLRIIVFIIRIMSETMALFSSFGTLSLVPILSTSSIG